MKQTQEQRMKNLFELGSNLPEDTQERINYGRWIAERWQELADQEADRLKPKSPWEVKAQSFNPPDRSQLDLFLKQD